MKYSSSLKGVRLSGAIVCGFCGLCVDYKSLLLVSPGSCFSMPGSWGHRPVNTLLSAGQLSQTVPLGDVPEVIGIKWWSGKANFWDFLFQFWFGFFFPNCS